MTRVQAIILGASFLVVVGILCALAVAGSGGAVPLAVLATQVAPAQGINVPSWIAWVLVVGGVLAFAGLIWRALRVVVPSLEAMIKLNDTTERIETKIEDLSTAQALDRQELQELHRYSHDAVHEIRDGFARSGLTVATVDKLTERLAEISEHLRDVPGRDLPPRGQ